jgi:hypothetical protein
VHGSIIALCRLRHGHPFERTAFWSADQPPWLSPPSRLRDTFQKDAHA